MLKKFQNISRYKLRLRWKDKRLKMYVYKIPSRIYRVNHHSLSRFQYKRRKHRINQEVTHLENQALTRSFSITFTRKLGETLSSDTEQALLRSLAKLGFCTRSNKRLLILYARNLEDAYTLATHWPVLLRQVQRLLSDEGYLTIYQGTPDECQEVLTMFAVAPIIDTSN